MICKKIGFTVRYVIIKLILQQVCSLAICLTMHDLMYCNLSRIIIVVIICITVMLIILWLSYIL